MKRPEIASTYSSYKLKNKYKVDNTSEMVTPNFGTALISPWLYWQQLTKTVASSQLFIEITYPHLALRFINRLNS